MVGKNYRSDLVWKVRDEMNIQQCSYYPCPFCTYDMHISVVARVPAPANEFIHTFHLAASRRQRRARLH
jgi:hypothetical protein